MSFLSLSLLSQFKPIRQFKSDLDLMVDVVAVPVNCLNY